MLDLGCKCTLHIDKNENTKLNKIFQGICRYQEKKKAFQEKNAAQFKALIEVLLAPAG